MRRPDVDIAREVLNAEGNALLRLAERLDADAFGRATELLLHMNGHAVVAGMGKSGHIAAKIAATLASTGTPAFHLHPSEAMHGDLGMLKAGDVLVAFSQSGSTEEVLNLLPYVKRLHIPIIALTGNGGSPLARSADVVLLTSIETEACPLNLAPTTSTTSQLGMGDALAMTLMERRGFTADDFAMRHPLGALGKRLLMRVSDLMHTGDENPVIGQEAPLRAAISTMTGKRLGTVSVVDDAGKLTGIFCDGDLRRLFDRLNGQVDATRPISEFMIRNPRFTMPDMLGVKAVDLMETHKITVLPVLDDERHPIGTIHLHDLIRAGITP